MVMHLMSPPASVLMVTLHRQLQANTTPALSKLTEQVKVCADGISLIQPPASVLMVHNHSLRLCNATAPDLATQQLVCSSRVTGPDPTTGLCADGSQPQPQSQSFNATTRWCCYRYSTTCL